MTDLEMTKLCAEAMGYGPFNAERQLFEIKWPDAISSWIDFDPLNNDAQAMALVKRFIKTIVKRNEGDWSINLDGGRNADLNRAIVECVAKMQERK